MLPKGRIAKPWNITEVSELTAEELSLLREPRATPSSVVTKFRDSHHRVAMLFAMGYKVSEIAQITGYSTSRINSLRAAPAFEDLIETKRDKLEEAEIAEEVEGLGRMKRQLDAAATRHLLDWFHELDDAGELAPPRVALAISADMSDRTGLSKHSTQTNFNANFAEALERAINNTNKVLEARSVPVHGPQPGPAPAARLPAPGRGGPRSTPDPLSFRRRA